MFTDFFSVFYRPSTSKLLRGGRCINIQTPLYSRMCRRAMDCFGYGKKVKSMILLKLQWQLCFQSVNGTLLNNILIGKNNRKNLEHGDLISLANNIQFKFELTEALPEDDDFIAVAEAVMDTVDLAESVINPVNSVMYPVNNNINPVNNVINPVNDNVNSVNNGISSVNSGMNPVSNLETSSSNGYEASSTSKLEEDDLTCSVCAELFIDAVTLVCSHTFCEFCINQWRKSNDLCPICRTRIKGQFPTLIVNNLVEKVTITFFTL